MRQWTEEMPDMRNIHQMGWTLVSMLRLQTANKAEESEVQGEASGKNKEAGTKSS